MYTLTHVIFGLHILLSHIKQIFEQNNLFSDTDKYFDRF